MDPFWLNMAVSERCRSEPRKGKKEWCDLIFWLWQTSSVQNTLLKGRGQGKELSTGTSIPHTAEHVPQLCCAAIPKARPSTAQCLLHPRENSWKPAWTCLHQLCSSDLTSRSMQPRGHWPHNLPTCHQVSQMLSFMLHKCHSDRLVCSPHTISNTMNRKEIYIHYKGSSHIQCGHKPVHTTCLWDCKFLPGAVVLKQYRYVLGIWLAVSGCLTFYDNCSVLVLHLKLSTTEHISPSCRFKYCAVMQQKHN